MIITTKQAAEMLQLHQEVLYRLLNKGMIPAFRVGGQWRLIQEDLIKWARGQYTVKAGMPSSEEPCHTNEKVVASGGSLSKEYDLSLIHI